MSNGKMEWSSCPLMQGITIIVMILPHLFFMVFRFTSIIHIFLCSLLSLLPLIVQLLMKLFTLLLCHLLPVNVINHVLISFSHSDESIFLHRDT